MGYCTNLVPSVNVISEGAFFHIASFNSTDDFLSTLGLTSQKRGFEVICQKDDVNRVEINKDHIAVKYISDDSKNLAYAYIAQIYLGLDSCLEEAVFEFPEPELKYRGFMLDSSRHFIPVDEVIRIIKASALIGYNTFHWHLTDDQGWRITLDGYPELVNKGSKRVVKDIKNAHTYEGIYTDYQLRKVVKLASKLGVAVIPEIDLPTHATALLSSYPEFGCTGKKLEVENRWGFFQELVNPFSDALWVFLDKLVEKLSSIFPGEYIHIGGEEAALDQWRSRDIKKLMKENGIKTPDELQTYFSNRFASLVKKHGKTVMKWSTGKENADLDPDIILMAGRTKDEFINAIKSSHRVIYCPASEACTFDSVQSEDLYDCGKPNCMASIKAVFESNWMPSEITKHQRSFVVGGEWLLWTERIVAGREAEYMIFPRAFALSENLALGKKKNWKSFKEKKHMIESLCTYLDLVFCPKAW